MGCMWTAINLIKKCNIETIFIFYQNNFGFFFLTVPNMNERLCHKEGYADPPSLRSGHLYIKDAQCAETNEKSYIRFLVFELLVAKDLTIWLQKKISYKI